jgi:hypothetical protein
MTEPQTTLVTDNGRAATSAIEITRKLISDSDQLSRPARITAFDYVGAESEFSTQNISTSAHREYYTQLHEPEDTSQSVTWMHLAYGDDETAESLGNNHPIK